MTIGADGALGVEEEVPLPDGAFLLFQGRFLLHANRLPEAEAVLRRSVESPSFGNHRRAAGFELVQAQWRLASRPGISAQEKAAWKEKALATLRAVAFAGKPLSPGPTARLLRVADDCGDLTLGLALAELCRREYKKIAPVPSHLRIPAGDACAYSGPEGSCRYQSLRSPVVQRQR